jgi:uncharacterized protein
VLDSAGALRNGQNDVCIHEDRAFLVPARFFPSHRNIAAWKTRLMKNTVSVLLFALCLAAPAFAQNAIAPVPAAWFDCGKAKTIPEKRICANPVLAELDGKMTAAFERARQHAGARAGVLRRDQLNWLADRNDWLSDSAFDAQKVADFYKRRIAFFEGAFQKPASPLLAAILARAAAVTIPIESDTWQTRYGRLHQAAAVTIPIESDTDVWAALSGNGAVFGMGETYEADLQETAKRMSADFDADPALMNQLTQADEDSDSTRTVVKFKAARMGGISTVAGTLHCASWTLFHWQGRTIEPINVPETLQDNCWEIWGRLVIFQNQVYAVQIATEVDSLDIQVQPYTQNGWGKAERLILHYERKLAAPKSYCTLEKCADLIAQAQSVIQRYDLRHDKATLIVSPLPPEQKKRFEAMREQAVGDDSMGTMPDFGKDVQILENDAYSQFDDYGGSDLFFPLRYQGETLLARMGNASFGWRTGDDWLLAAWRWDGHAFTPMLGMSVAVRRGNFLFGSVAVPASSGY